MPAILPICRQKEIHPFSCWLKVMKPPTIKTDQFQPRGKREIKREGRCLKCRTVSVAHACRQGGEMVKLNLLFIVMDLLTLMIYPALFVHGKLRRFVRTKENITLTNSLAAVLVAPDE